MREAIGEYSRFSHAEVGGFEVPSGVSPQPKSLEETIRGSMNRARSAFKSDSRSVYGIGLESGLMEVPYTKTGFMDVCACAIFDGNRFHLGLSSVFEYPIEVTRLVLEEGLDVTEAFNATGLSQNEKLGSAEGAIGLLTGGRVTRKDYTKQAIVTAMVHLENPELY